MKQSIMFLSALFVFATYAYADRSVPESSNGGSVPAEYGGLSYSTQSFTTVGSSVPGKCVVVGVLFSSGAANTFFYFFYITSSFLFPSLVGRIYNTANSTMSFSDATSAAAGGYVTAGNIRIRNNLFWRFSSALFNMVTLLYHREGD